MFLLNKNSNVAIVLAGIVAIIVAAGVARFAFTSLLPLMKDDFLSIKFAGILASLNYIGYFLGACFAIFINSIHKKVYYFRIGLFISIISSLILALSTNEILWIISRLIAGFGTAMILVVCSSLVMKRLSFENKTKAMGIYFSGIGLSIFVTEIFVSLININSNLWQESWLYLTIFAIILTIYPLYILNIDKTKKVDIEKYKFDKTLFTPFAIILIVAYFCEGVGFVVQATFLPDIINSIEALKGYGNLTWLIAGFAGVFSTIIWMSLANKFGSVNIIIVALLFQVVGILIPTFTNNIYLNLLSGLLYGATFVGLVALFMNLGGKLSKNNPVVLMGAITSAYSLGMITAPLYCVALYEMFNSYNYALYLTALIVLFAAILLSLTKKLNSEKI